jgi:prepilin-type N-terminal cleavage/methylation domain-containing protein
MNFSKKQAGFTIVELLIVIVVIGILAAIVIVAYSGVQNRANNSQIVTLVRAYAAAVSSYNTDKGFYPATTSCLGTGYPGGTCHADGGAYSENNGNFNTVLLKDYLPQPPTVRSVHSPLSGKWVDTALYTWNNASYNPTGASIAFAQYGTTTCPSVAGMRLLVGNNFSDNSGIWCRFALD